MASYAITILEVNEKKSGVLILEEKNPKSNKEYLKKCHLKEMLVLTSFPSFHIDLF